MARGRSLVQSELVEAKKAVERLEVELASLDEDRQRLGRPEDALSLREYKRYGRQMVLSQIGLPGQLALKRAKILVVGAGGLGCPVLLYLTAAGVGDITILDHDSVELSNLHRQVLHTEARVGVNKAESARRGLVQLNSDVAIHALPLAFTPSLFTTPDFSPPPTLAKPEFNLILDCTDNPATRHFLSAYAAAFDIPLVSGGAVRAEGTVGVYGLPLTPASGSVPASSPDRGPCYACVFAPIPPPSPPLSDEQIALQGTGSCSDEGVLGVLCGVVGLSMCAEAVKVLLGLAKPTLHLFSPLSPTPFRTIKLRLRSPTCPTCSSPVSHWTAFLETGQWPTWEDPHCAVPGVGEGTTGVEARITAAKLGELDACVHAVVLDTRSPAEFGICSVPGSVNVPFATLLKDPTIALRLANRRESQEGNLGSRLPIYFVCRRGNDSLLAARAVRRSLLAAEGDEGGEGAVGDVVGGLLAWSREVDGEFPIYY